MKKAKKGGYLSGSTKTKLLRSTKRKSLSKSRTKNRTFKNTQYSKTQSLFRTKTQ